MTTKTEALKLAISRLEWFIDSYPHDITTSKEEFLQPFKEALAQPEQEPVALMIYRGELCYKSQEDDQSFGMWCPIAQDLPFLEGTKFYTTPPHSFFEDVADELRVEIAELQDHVRLLEKQLSQSERTWVGLTDEDWTYMRTNCGSIRSAVETAESKLKEKNT